MSIKIIECPRDAMQGLPEFITTDKKVAYINALLQVGFDTIDFGSFVSPKAIPQLRDTTEVLSGLDLSGTKSKLLAIIGNKRGAEDACHFEEITYLGFPYSVSPTFLKLNIKSSREEAFKTIRFLTDLCSRKNKELVVYLSMAFGNPYGDDSSTELILEAVEELNGLGIKIISMADTVGVGDEESIGAVFENVVHAFKHIEFGFHLHTSPDSYHQKIEAAYKHGCTRFDSVMLGMGGCPMSGRELVGNLSTELLLDFFKEKGVEVPLNKQNYLTARKMAQETFWML
ncbi:MAG: hydroxymethylglutaryl-CoA lyase [Bacteroidia bacterium]